MAAGGPDGRLAAMNQVIAWAGFLGAWLLVAGPLYQGAIEGTPAARAVRAQAADRRCQAPVACGS